MADVNYKELTQYNSPNYTPYSMVRQIYGMDRYIEGVVYHWWGDPNNKPQFLNIINWLCRANGNSSAHTVGEGGRVAWIIDAINAAWHAGNARGNARYVGYECNPRLSDEDYQTMGEFHYTMEKAYRRTLEIRVHKEFSSTQCSPIDKNRIRRIADSLHNQDKTPAPVWVRMDNPRQMVAINDLYVVNLDTNKNQGDKVKAGTKIDFNMKKTVGGVLYVRSVYSTSKNLNWGIRAEQLKEVVVAPEPTPDPEWLRNLKDIEDKKLSVLPAAGVKVLNLTTLAPVNDTIIPKGTQIDIVKETKVGGISYYLSSYAVTTGVPWGIRADQLGTPAVEPPKEKPEWLENLEDIADQDFWTRSETAVLNIEDGSTSRVLPINTKVRITHVTEILGDKYMVLDGLEEVVQPIYLSDTEISNPDDDIESRLNVLEKIVAAIVNFLTTVFNNFKVK